MCIVVKLHHSHDIEHFHHVSKFSPPLQFIPLLLPMATIQLLSIPIVLTFVHKWVWLL